MFPLQYSPQLVTPPPPPLSVFAPATSSHLSVCILDTNRHTWLKRLSSSPHKLPLRLIHNALILVAEANEIHKGLPIHETRVYKQVAPWACKLGRQYFELNVIISSRWQFSEMNLGYYVSPWESWSKWIQPDRGSHAKSHYISITKNQTFRFSTDKHWKQIKTYSR